MVQRWLILALRLKWRRDKRHLPLGSDSRELYERIHRLCFRELRRFPDLINPRDYNDKIQWLKLFDQCEEIVRCTDKIALRGYVSERLGFGYTPNLLQTCKSWNDINKEALPGAFVIKTNHDSGTVILVRNKSALDWDMAKKRINRSLTSHYGHSSGEWAYAMIEPMVLVEELLNPFESDPPADYKFHCVNGTVCWMHYIRGRYRALSEVLVDRQSTVMDLQLNLDYLPARDFDPPTEWHRLVEVAETLAHGWKYVRVDLYLVEGRILVGEMTFFPYMGCYRGPGQKELGKLLDFDRQTFKPPIHSSGQET